jgi:broad specificity phosphatase PhoE
MRLLSQTSLYHHVTSVGGTTDYIWQLSPHAMRDVSPTQVKNPDPTAEEVEAVYERFKAELARLYDQHRPQWEHRPLRFVEHG